MNKEALTQKWLAGELNPEERQAFEALDDYAESVTIIETASLFKASHHGAIPEFEHLEARLNSAQRQNSSQWRKQLLRVAALFTIGMGLYFALFYKPIVSVETAAAEKTELSLPDGSKVFLNAVSQLSYRDKNWEDNRNLQMEGEAFFDVNKGSTFTVQTPHGEVQVLGTEFNVKQRGDFFEVTCFEGRVQVKTDTETEILEVGDSFRWMNGTITLEKTTHRAPKWRESISNFKAVPLLEVLQELERQYNITLEYEDIDVTILFTGGFVHNNLENALKSITQPLHLVFVEQTNDTFRLQRSE